MLPIVLHPQALNIGVAGQGEGLNRKLDLLRRAGIEPAAVFAARIPEKSELASLRILFVAGLSEPLSRGLAQTARGVGVLVNVEDMPSLCDFHVPAQVRRGDLLLTVSTGGRAPGLSRALREVLEQEFGPEWSQRLELIADLRRNWQSEGLGGPQLSQRMRAFLSQQGWLA